MKRFLSIQSKLQGGGQNSNIYCNKNSLALTQLPETIFNRKSIGKIIVKAL